MESRMQILVCFLWIYVVVEQLCVKSSKDVVLKMGYTTK